LRIKRLTLTRFGKFIGKSVEIGDGFNVIHGKNEAGKSTLAAFILFMLYGMPKERVSKGNPLPDRERFVPWGEDSVAGTMEIEAGGRDIVIERQYKKGANTGAKVYYKATGEAVPGFEGAEPGQVLFEVGSQAFGATVFIRQSELMVEDCAELELKLRNLVTGAEEDVSYANAQRRLDTARKRLENQRGGMIAELSKEIGRHRESLARANLAMEGWQRDNERRRELEKERDSVKKELEALKERIKYVRARAALDKLESIREARREEKRIAAGLADVEKSLVAGDAVIDGQLVAKLRQTAHDLRLEQKRLEMCELDVAQSQKRLEQLEDELSAFGSLTEEAEAVREKLKTASSVHSRMLLLIGSLLIILGLFGLFGSFLMGMMLETILPSVLILVGGAFSVSLHFTRADQNSADSVARRYGYPHADKLAEALDSIQKLMRERDAARMIQDEARERYERQTAVTRGIADELALLTADFALPKVSTATVELLCSTLSEKLRQQEFYKKRLDAVCERLAGLLMGVDEQALESLAASGAAPPDGEAGTETDERQAEQRSLELESRLEALTAELAELSSRMDSAFAPGQSPAEISERLETLCGRRSRLEFNRDALSLSLSVLCECFETLQMTFAPELNRRAGDYFASLTGRAGRELVIDSRSNVRISDGSALRELNYFSQGTRDAAYLSVRLAAVSLIFTREPPPLVFDDILARFDPERSANAIRMLAAVGGLSQVILFTCRSDEAKVALAAGASVIGLS